MDIKEQELYFAKVSPEAKIPEKRDEDAGYDLYPCFQQDYIMIEPMSTALIPTGIATAMHPSKYIQLEERGSTGSKGLKRSAGVIDSGYRGEIFVALTNCNNVPIVINRTLDEAQIDKNFIVYPYEKAICQAIVHEVPVMEVAEVTYEELQQFESERGDGALGSTET